MTEEEVDKFTEAFEFLSNINGVSKRVLNTLPKRTLISIKETIDSNYVTKDKMKEVLKDFIKKDTVDDKYVKKTTVEKNYVPKEEVPDLQECDSVFCPECNEINYKIVYNHEGEQLDVFHCRSCGSYLFPAPKPKKVKKYPKRPQNKKRSSKYVTKN